MPVTCSALCPHLQLVKTHPSHYLLGRVVPLESTLHLITARQFPKSPKMPVASQPTPLSSFCLSSVLGIVPRTLTLRYNASSFLSFILRQILLSSRLGCHYSPATVSQSAGTPGMSHHAQLLSLFYLYCQLCPFLCTLRDKGIQRTEKVHLRDRMKASLLSPRSM